MEFNGKVVAITGAARGIGLEVARQIAAEGGKLVLSDVNEAGVRAAAVSIAAVGGQAIGVRCDVSSDAEVDAMALACAQAFGPADLLINNAAAQHVGPGNIDEIDFARWQESFDVNVLGDVRTVKAFLPGMLARGSGYIVNTASSLAIRPNAVIQHLMPYVTSKGAVLTFTYALAYAMQNRGIKVSLYCPGLTQTSDAPMRPNANGWFDGVREDLTVPGAMDVAASILLDGIRAEQFLISSEPDYEASIVRLAQHGLDPLSDYH